MGYPDKPGDDKVGGAMTGWGWEQKIQSSRILLKA